MEIISWDKCSGLKKRSLGLDQSVPSVIRNTSGLSQINMEKWKAKAVLGCPEWQSAEINKIYTEKSLYDLYISVQSLINLLKISFNLCFNNFQTFQNKNIYVFISNRVVLLHVCKFFLHYHISNSDSLRRLQNWINSENYMTGDTLILLFIKN